MPPVNDNLANARVITADVSYSDTTVGATNEGSEFTPGDEAYDHDDVGVWYRLEWSATGKWLIRVTNANFTIHPIYGALGYAGLIYAPSPDPPSDYGDLSEFNSFQSFASNSDKVFQTGEGNSGDALYIRMGAGQSSGFPYYTSVGTFDIEFEFVTPPYNPGSPPANDLSENAELLTNNDSVSGTTQGATGGFSGADTVWYRIEPAEDIVVKFVVERTGGDTDWHPYFDLYRLNTGDPLPADGTYDGLDDYIGWLGDSIPWPKANPAHASFALKGGEVYMLEVYDLDGFFNADFTITTSTGHEPSNDNVANATALSSIYNVITGTTIDASQEIWEAINWDGSMTPSVWYRIPVGGPGVVSMEIESLTPDWEVQWELFYKTGDPTGTVTTMEDLSEDSNFVEGDTYDDPDIMFSRPSQVFYSEDGDLFPLEGGEQLYMRITGFGNREGEGFSSFTGTPDCGNFRLTVTNPPPEVCLDAQDYLNPSSTTASIVSGSVRESQYVPEDQGGIAPHTPKHWQGWFDELKATLIIPGEDIASTPGFYAVHCHHKNTDGVEWLAGMRRNGQPLWPGALMDENNTGTPHQNWLTMMAGDVRPNELDMVKYLPVQPGDEIEVIFANGDYGDDSHLSDIIEVCFQRILNGVEGEPYALLTIPDYPLGTSSSDMGTNDQQGDLIVGKDDPSPNDFIRHAVYDADMCVTDDGTLWVVHTQQNGGFSSTFTGPVLQYWNGSSWVVVDDDIEGLGVKSFRPNYALSAAMSIDTDGEDLWICYGIDAGINAPSPSTTHSTHIRVKKYDVSANTFSNVGSPFHGTRSDVGSATLTYAYAIAEAGNGGETPIIRVSPAGVPWVVFTDAMSPASSSEDWGFWQMRHYVARWTGSTWDVDLLPGPYEANDDYSITTYQAEACTLGPTASSTTYLGKNCVEDTQTTFANDTISFTPPAGKWCFKVSLALDWVSGGTAGLSGAFYKNGVRTVGAGIDNGYNLGTVDHGWDRFGFIGYYFDCNGSDVISYRLKKDGTGVAHVYIDDIVQVDAHRVMENVGNGFNARYVDDGQPQAMLYMHQVGDTGYGENPGVLYMTPYTRPFLTIAERDAATPPVGWDSMEEVNDFSDNYDSMVLPPETVGNYTWSWHTWIYAEWNGSEWVKLWNKLIEEDAPDHLYVNTLSDGIPSTPPVGHFQQGFGGCTDGKNNYMTANLGGGQGFGFFGDTIVALKIGPEGFIPFSQGPPGHLQGPGYPQGLVMGLSGFYSWGWDTGGRSLHVDTNENIWLAWNGIGGALFEYSDFVATAAPNGIGGWFAAAEENEDFGYDNTFMPTGVVVSSPDGDYVYVMFDVQIWSDNTPPNEPYTFGVFKCSVTQNAKIPLIPIFIGGKAIRVYPDGSYEILDRSPQRVTIDPSGEVQIISTQTDQRVIVKIDGTVNIL